MRAIKQDNRVRPSSKECLGVEVEASSIGLQKRHGIVDERWDIAGWRLAKILFFPLHSGRRKPDHFQDMATFSVGEIDFAASL